MSGHLRARLLFGAVAVASFAADRFSKAAIREFLEARPGNILTIIPGWIDIIMAHNRGGAFSLFEGVRSLLVFAPILLAIGLTVYMFTRKEVPMVMAVSLGLLLGGAAGNLIDRIRLGYVFDFIDCHAGNLHWPTYNVADICIVAGTILLAWMLVRMNGAEPAEEPKKSRKR